MKPVYLSSNTIISPLGFTSAENANHIAQEVSGIKLHHHIGKSPVHAALLEETVIDTEFQKIGKPSLYTKLEKMMLLALQDTIAAAEFQISERTALIIATTKGNVDVLERTHTFPKERAYLPVLGKQIAEFFGFKQEPIMVSNACVSGVLAIAVAKRMIQNDFYDNAFIVAGDIVSEFTLSGFQSFQAISDAPCKPFSKHRNGITIGEAAAAVAVSADKNSCESNFEILGDGSCNDANHISGPSRDGEGLYQSIQSALKESELSVDAIDYISAHGTATRYNDEMEAIAFNRANLEQVPVNSLKGYYGHTLGASGLLETIIGMQALKNNCLHTSLGYDEHGVSVPLNLIKASEEKPLNTILKTASGFGGCNTAILLKQCAI